MLVWMYGRSSRLVISEDTVKGTRLTAPMKTELDAEIDGQTTDKDGEIDPEDGKENSESDPEDVS